MRRMLVQSYPNREIRVTLVNQPSSHDKTYETNNWTEPFEDSPPAPPCHSLKTRNASDESESTPIQLTELQVGFGRLGSCERFSNYGRRQVLRAGGALEQVAKHEEVLFLTLTLPGSTTESMKALAEWSGFAVHRLKAWINKRVVGKYDMYCWELQKRGALHLHYCVHCPEREVGEYIRTNLREEWCRILDAIAERSGIDVYKRKFGGTWADRKEKVRVDAQWCEKSIAAYLSKYVSKSANDPAFGGNKFWPPSRWYGVSRPLLAVLRELTKKVSIDWLKESDAWGMYEDCLSLLQSFAVKCYDYIHKVGAGKTVVAYTETNEQDSIWNHIMTQICPTQDSLSNTEQNMRRLTRNGCILLKKQPTWLKEFMAYYANSRPASLLNSPSFRDISRSDLIFLVDALAYSFRSHQRTRFELPGACKLWYSQMKNVIDTAPSEDSEWIGHLKL